MGDDNVIPFPGAGAAPNGQEGERTQSLERLTRELVERILASGRSAQDLSAEVVRQLPAHQTFELTWEEPQLLVQRTEPAAYTLRVDLAGATPPVWRRLTLASDLTLDRVHDVLQAAMGWTDSHLHQFRSGPGPVNHRLRPFLTAYDLAEGETEGIPETEVRLDQVLADVGDRLHYEYDFGDGWEHTLRLERVAKYDGGPAARCTGGRRACPPEDVGGVHVFNEVVAWLAEPDSDVPEDPGLRRVVEWLPPGYRPDAFEVAEVEQALAQLLG